MDERWPAADIPHLLHAWREAKRARRAARQTLDAAQAAVIAAEQALLAAGVEVTDDEVTWDREVSPGRSRDLGRPGEPGRSADQGFRVEDS
jgi:hypothetical protein